MIASKTGMNAKGTFRNSLRQEIISEYVCFFAGAYHGIQSNDSRSVDTNTGITVIPESTVINVWIHATRLFIGIIQFTTGTV